MSKNRIFHIIGFIVAWFFQSQLPAFGQTEWNYTFYDGIVADDVAAHCHCNHSNELKSLNFSINNRQQLLHNLDSEPKITLNCSFGIIDAEVQLLTNAVRNNENEFIELKGKLLNSDYFSSWKGIVKDAIFEGYLFAYGEMDSVAFRLEENYDNALDFDVLLFKDELNVLERQVEVDGQIKETAKEIRTEDVYILEDKPGEHYTYNLLNNVQKIHFPKSANENFKNIYKKLYFQTVNAQTYVIDEQRFKDSINQLLKIPILEACQQGFNNDKRVFVKELQAETYAPIMNDFFLASEIKYNSNKLLGLCFNTHAYTGGAHGLPHSACYSLNVEQATIIQLSDLFEDGTACSFNKLLKREIANYAKSNKIGYIVDLTSDCNGNYYDLDFPNSYYINDAGITMVYQVYTLFSFSDGIIHITIPAADLNTITKKESLAWEIWFGE